MRSYSFDLTTAQPALLITLTRTDGTVIRVTTWPSPITIGGNTWTRTPGLLPGDVVEHNDGNPASWSFQVSALSGGLFDPEDIGNGKYDSAQVEVDICDANNPTAADFHYFGEVGNIDLSTLDAVTFDVRSPYAFPNNIFIGVFTLMCDTDFGSNDCRIPVMRPEVQRNETIAIGDCRRHRFGADGTPEDYSGVYLEATAITTGVTAATEPSFSSTVDATTVDGGVTWTTRASWERAAKIAAVIDAHNFTLDRDPDARATTDSYYTPGRFQMQSGYSNNKSARIGRYRVSGRQITTYLPIGLTVDVDDWLFIWPDCDKTMSMCTTKYANAANYQGFVYQLGAKAAAAQGLL